MSWGSNHPLVRQLNQITPEGLKGKELSPLEHARSNVETARLFRETVGCQRAATVSFYKRDQLAVRLEQLDRRIAFLEAIVERLEREEAQGGAQ